MSEQDKAAMQEQIETLYETEVQEYRELLQRI